MLKWRLKELRKKAQLTQAKMAEKLEVPLSTYLNWEQGTRNPDYCVMSKIADIYNCSVDYLIGRVDNKDEYIKVINIAKKQKIPADKIASFVEFLVASR